MEIKEKEFRMVSNDENTVKSVGYLWIKIKLTT